MTREQQEVCDQICLQAGRVHVDEGYADGSVRITEPSGKEWHVAESGRVIKQWLGTNHVDWSYE